MKKLTKGIKTSEFYVAIVGIGTIVWQQVQTRCQFDTPFVLATGAIVASYIVGRTYLKGKK